jgi:hypothetical protein
MPLVCRQIAPALKLCVIILASLLAREASAQINVVRDLGCKLDDFAFDNGPILNAAFARVGQAKQGMLNEEFYFPGGAIVFKTPLVLPRKTGVAIRGNGITIALPEGEFGRTDRTGGPASRLVYVGPADKPAITYRGMGLRLDGLTIQRGAYPSPPAGPVRDGSIGLLIEGYNGIPTGKLYAPQLSFIRFDTAIHISALPKENHADQNQFGYVWSQSCATVFRSDNLQSVGNQFQFLAVGGQCETVFDIRRGGDLFVDTLILNTKALVFKLRDVEHNTNCFVIRNLKADNNSVGWRLVEMQKPRPVRIHVDGHISRRATPAPDAIKLLGDANFQDVKIDMWWWGKSWPADFKDGEMPADATETTKP